MAPPCSPCTPRFPEQHRYLHRCWEGSPGPLAVGGCHNGQLVPQKSTCMMRPRAMHSPPLLAAFRCHPRETTRLWGVSGTSLPAAHPVAGGQPLLQGGGSSPGGAEAHLSLIATRTYPSCHSTQHRQQLGYHLNPCFSWDGSHRHHKLHCDQASSDQSSPCTKQLRWRGCAQGRWEMGHWTWIKLRFPLPALPSPPVSMRPLARRPGWVPPPALPFLSISGLALRAV